MNFIIMAAHDTLTSSLTSFVWFLSSKSEWQERLRAEVRSLVLSKDEPLPQAINPPGDYGRSCNRVTGCRRGSD